VSEADCIFCKIARGEIDAANLEEIGGLSDRVVKRLFEVSSAVAAEAGVTEGGYAVRVNNGRDAGQEVFHLHLHVMGGRKLGMP
jgi:histidine triad (HIT) family protein